MQNLVRLVRDKMKSVPIIEQCPFCSKRGVELNTRKLVVSKIFYDWYFYDCKFCGESFTTTESDTVSYENFKIISLSNGSSN